MYIYIIKCNSYKEISSACMSGFHWELDVAAKLTTWRGVNYVCGCWPVSWHIPHLYQCWHIVIISICVYYCWLCKWTFPLCNVALEHIHHHCHVCTHFAASRRMLTEQMYSRSRSIIMQDTRSPTGDEIRSVELFAYFFLVTELHSWATVWIYCIF